MSEGGSAEGIISRVELAALAELFDRFEHAFQPQSLAAREAESAFESRVRSLYEERVAPRFASFGLITFHAHVKTLCRAYLKKNVP